MTPPTDRGEREDRRKGLILGLGNPGARYEETRHNLGFMTLDRLAEKLEAGRRGVECNSVVVEVEGLLLAWPQTYMNRSGYAARCLSERHDIDPGGVLVVYDEVALPLGRLRLRSKGGPGGHRGMESVIGNLRSEKIARLRLGIGTPDGAVPGDDLSDYVLEPFRADERETAEEMVERAADACLAWWREGLEPAMNEFNRE